MKCFSERCIVCLLNEILTLVTGADFRINWLMSTWPERNTPTHCAFFCVRGPYGNMITYQLNHSLLMFWIFSLRPTVIFTTFSRLSNVKRLCVGAC